eukprot:gene27684-33433_t
MSSMVAMIFEKVVSGFPVKVNPVLSILFAWLLAYVPHFLKRPYVIRKLKEKNETFDIANSRHIGVQLADNTATGKIIAAHTGCHQNGLEAFSFFAVAMILAIQFHVDLGTLEASAGLFLALRTLYTISYLTSLNGVLRSVAWFLGVLT